MPIQNLIPYGICPDPTCYGPCTRAGQSPALPWMGLTRIMIAISSRRNLSQELLSPRHQAPWPDFVASSKWVWCRYLRHVDRRTNASEGRSTKVVQGTKTHQQLNDLEVNCMPCLIVVERRCSTRAMPTQAAACRFEHRTSFQVGCGC